MTNETKIAVLQARINLLSARDEVGNMRIINKLKRRIRLMEGK